MKNNLHLLNFKPITKSEQLYIKGGHTHTDWICSSPGDDIYQYLPSGCQD